MKVPYNLFNKWYRDTRHSVVPVAIDGRPTEDEESSIIDSIVEDAVRTNTIRQKNSTRQETTTAIENTSKSGTLIMIDLRTTEGLQIRRRGMTYTQFLEFAKNLKSLC